MTPQTTVNDIVRLHGDKYLLAHPHTPLHERKVLRSLAICRTEHMGGRVETCTNCGHKVILYNSCRNRHCPQCQAMKKEKWILNRKSEVLPFTYFHIVFTLPDILSPIALRNKRTLYKLLFDSCRETLLSVSADEKYFGAAIGFFAVLHTWGQKMNLHPHLHCVVPGGGYSESKGTWIHAPHNYFVPVQVLKMRFRSLFLTGLKNIYGEGKLYLAGTPFDDPTTFRSMVNTLFATEWVVYLKESFQKRESVIHYLARYTHRIAISNHRIRRVSDDTVSFTYRDYKDGNREKVMELPAVAFLHRFLMHVVPWRFVRIRYYGILAHRNKKRALQTCREFYGIADMPEPVPSSWQEVYLHVTGKNVSSCPACNSGMLIVTEFLEPVRYRAPPVHQSGFLSCSSVGNSAW